MALEEAPTAVSLYAQVVHITQVYLGPAADRFIARQVQNHLHKDPDELSEQDLDKLIDWVRLAISFLTEDSAIVEEYISRLRRLASESQTSSSPKEPHHAT